MLDKGTVIRHNNVRRNVIVEMKNKGIIITVVSASNYLFGKDRFDAKLNDIYKKYNLIMNLVSNCDRTLRCAVSQSG